LSEIFETIKVLLLPVFFFIFIAFLHVELDFRTQV